jgi:acyl-CoA synthetase (AMP-forming)/AMP-acid ligase II
MHWLLLVNPRFKETDVSTVENVVYGGAPCPPELVRNLKNAFPRARLGNGFGLTETSSISTFLPHELCEQKPDSVGPPAPVVETKIVDDSGDDLPAGAVGEIWIKGPNIVAGYWRKPEATAESFTDGWLHSGDVGKLDEDRCLYVLDRKKDMIIRGGENIYCVEVENAIYAHPKVLEAAVVGVPDEVFGEQVKAVVVPKPGQDLTEEDLKRWMNEHLADYKRPKYWVIQTGPLPRNPAGKVLKPALR